MNTPWVRSSRIQIPLTKQVGARAAGAWGDTYRTPGKPDRADTFVRRGMEWDTDIQPIIDWVNDPTNGLYRITDHNGHQWDCLITNISVTPNDSEGGSTYFTVTLEADEPIRVTP